MLKYLLLLFVVSTEYAQKKASSTFYRDLKNFALEGAKPLTKNELNQYPYFELMQLSTTKKRMVLWSNAHESEVRDFKKINGYWTYFQKKVDDDEMDTSYVYEYYSANRKLTLIYSGNPNGSHYRLGQMIIETKQTLESYLFPFKTIKLKPSPTIDVTLKKIKNKSSSIGRFTIKGSVLSIESLSDVNVQHIKKSQRCFNLEKWKHIHSIYWWTFFQGEDISCP